MIAQIDMPETVAPTDQESSLARESNQRLAQLLGSAEPVEVLIRPENSSEAQSVAIPLAAFRMLKDILTQMAQGNAVTLIPVHAELTTQQAADILNVSRPFLVEQLEKGVIPHRKVGKHRRVLFRDVVAYKQAIDQKRTQTLDELAALDQELGLR